MADALQYSDPSGDEAESPNDVNGNGAPAEYGEDAAGGNGAYDRHPTVPMLWDGEQPPVDLPPNDDGYYNIDSHASDDMSNQAGVASRGPSTAKSLRPIANPIREFKEHLVKSSLYEPLEQFEDEARQTKLILDRMDVQDALLLQEQILQAKEKEDDQAARRHQKRLDAIGRHLRKSVKDLRDDMKRAIVREEKRLQEALKKKKVVQKEIETYFKISGDRVQDFVDTRKTQVLHKYGDLVTTATQQFSLSSVDWESYAQQVEVHITSVRGLKDKVPNGKYVVLVSKYTKLGGEALRWSLRDPDSSFPPACPLHSPTSDEDAPMRQHCEICQVGGRGHSAPRLLPVKGWLGSTTPITHDGKFTAVDLALDTSIFTYFPPVKKIKPYASFIFELVLLPKNNEGRPQTVGWGAFPVVDSFFNVIKGKFKTALLRGEMDNMVEHYSKIERNMKNDLEAWLGNLYFEVTPYPRECDGDGEFDIEAKLNAAKLGLDGDRYPEPEKMQWTVDGTRKGASYDDLLRAEEEGVLEADASLAPPAFREKIQRKKAERSAGRRGTKVDLGFSRKPSNFGPPEETITSDALPPALKPQGDEPKEEKKDGLVKLSGLRSLGRRLAGLGYMAKRPPTAMERNQSMSTATVKRPSTKMSMIASETSCRQPKASQATLKEQVSSKSMQKSSAGEPSDKSPASPKSRQSSLGGDAEEEKKALLPTALSKKRSVLFGGTTTFTDRNHEQHDAEQSTSRARGLFGKLAASIETSQPGTKKLDTISAVKIFTGLGATSTTISDDRIAALMERNQKRRALKQGDAAEESDGSDDMDSNDDSSANDSDNEMLARNRNEVNEEMEGEAIFDLIDENNDGVLDKDEICNFLEEYPELKERLGVLEFDAFFERLDVNKDGTVDREEFAAVWATQASGAIDLFTNFKELGGAKEDVMSKASSFKRTGATPARFTPGLTVMSKTGEPSLLERIRKAASSKKTRRRVLVERGEKWSAYSSSTVNKTGYQQTDELIRWSLQLEYCWRGVLDELALKKPDTPRFWFIQLIFLLCLYVQLYIHGIGQFMALKILGIPTSGVDPVVYGLLVEYDRNHTYAYQELFIVFWSMVLNTFIVFLLILISTGFKVVTGTFPHQTSKFVYCLSIAYYIFPFVHLVIDLHLDTRYDNAGVPRRHGDIMRLIDFYNDNRYEPFFGVTTFCVLYFNIGAVLAVMNYLYTMRIHLNGILQDCFWRINVANDRTLFVPMDLEVSMRELSYVVMKAERWRGMNGERRKTMVSVLLTTDEDDEDYVSKQMHVAIYQLGLHETMPDGRRVQPRKIYREFYVLTTGAIVEARKQRQPCAINLVLGKMSAKDYLAVDRKLLHKKDKKKKEVQKTLPTANRFINVVAKKLG